MTRETIKYAGPDSPISYEGFAVDWRLRRLGFEPGEVERRRFLDRHHHLITPLFYSPQARLARDRQLMVEAWQAMERAGAPPQSGA